MLSQRSMCCDSTEKSQISFLKNKQKKPVSKYQNAGLIPRLLKTHPSHLFWKQTSFHILANLYGCIQVGSNGESVVSTIFLGRSPSIPLFIGSLPSGQKPVQSQQNNVSFWTGFHLLGKNVDYNLKSYMVLSW